MNISICAAMSQNGVDIARLIGPTLLVEEKEVKDIEGRYVDSNVETYSKGTETTIFVGDFAPKFVHNSMRVFLYRDCVTDAQYVRKATQSNDLVSDIVDRAMKRIMVTKTTGIKEYSYDVFDMNNYDLIIDTSIISLADVAELIKTYRAEFEAGKKPKAPIVLLAASNIIPQVDTFRGNAYKQKDSAVPVIFVGGTWFTTATKPAAYKDRLNNKIVTCTLTNVPLRVYTLDASEYLKWDSVYGKVLNKAPIPYIIELTPDVEFRYRKSQAFKRKDVEQRNKNELEALCSKRQCKMIRDYINKGAAFIPCGTEYAPKEAFMLAIRHECRKPAGDGVNVYDADVLFSEQFKRPIVLLCLNDVGNTILLESIRVISGHQVVTKHTASLSQDKI